MGMRRNKSSNYMGNHISMHGTQKFDEIRNHLKEEFSWYVRMKTVERSSRFFLGRYLFSNEVDASKR